MQKALLSTCLLLVSLSPVTSLTCSYCRSYGTSCEGDTGEVCNSTSTCTSGVLDNNIVPEYKTATYRGCTDSKGCHSGDYSISTADGKYLQMKTGCCGIDKCNQEPRCVKPRMDFLPNGLQCQACFGISDSASTPTCQNQGTVSCLGNETKCIELSSINLYRYGIKKMKLEGCATADVCALDKKKIIFGHLGLHKIVTKCSDAKKSSK